jgi:hypothetical protein
MHGSHGFLLAHMNSFNRCEYYDAQMKRVVVYGNMCKATT